MSRVEDRLDHILDAIDQIDALLAERGLEKVMQDRIVRAAFERFVEIISEASRHIPAGLKARHDDIPWRRIADIGNHLRHGYDNIDLAVYWKLVSGRDLQFLKETVLAMQAELAMKTGEKP